MNASTQLTGLVIQMRRLEAIQHAANYRLAVWTVAGAALGFVAGMAVALL